jgi:hypothetical protein
MAGYDYDKRLLFFKIEATEGVDATPVAADAIVTRGLQPLNYEADPRVREIDGLYFGARPQTQAQRRARTSFEVELTGGGTAVTVPPWMKLLRIGGMDAGTVGGSSVIQRPISAGVPSATLWDYTDTLKQTMLGARADFRMTFEDDQFPFLSMDVMGFPPSVLAVDSAAAAPNVAAFQAPIYSNQTNTVITLDGYAAEVRRVEIVAGSVLTPRSFIGSADRVKYRNRVWTATALIKCPTIASKNYFTKMDGQQVNMTITHGLVAGQIVEVVAPLAEINLSTQSDEEGDLMLSIPLRLIPSSAGNDEISITSK